MKPITVTPYEATENDRTAFSEKGYVVAPKLLSDDDIRRLREALLSVFRGEIDTQSPPYEYKYWYDKVKQYHEGSIQIMKINNAWWINKTISSLVHSSVIGKIAADLLGTDEIRIWHDQAILKPALGDKNSTEKSGNIGWHQDYGYWQVSNNPNMITAWIPLQDVGTENGSLRTITGSHKWGLIPGSAEFFNPDLDGLKDKFSKHGDWTDEPSIMKAGQVAFHHALTFHGSGPNLSPDHRLAIAIHMQPKDCGLQLGRGWHHNLRDLAATRGPLGLKEGDQFVGPAFPVIYSRNN